MSSTHNDGGTTGGSVLVTLASGQSYAEGIAVNDTSVFWTTNPPPVVNDAGAVIGERGAVMSAPLNGGTPATLASGQRAPYSPILDDTSVYWTESGGRGAGAIVKAPLGGGALITLVGTQAPSAADALWLAVTPSKVYWTTQYVSDDGEVTLGAVLTVPQSGGLPVTLASNQEPAGIAVDATNLYWKSAATVLSIPLDGVPDGGTPTTLASGQAAFRDGCIAIDATNVYWTTNSLISSPDAGVFLPDGAVMKVPLAGGSVTTLASGRVQPERLAVDGTSVYWTGLGSAGNAYNVGSGGRVMKVAVNGGTPTTLASGQAYPEAIAVDGTSVYWTNFGTCSADAGTCAGGAVMKLTPK